MSVSLAISKSEKIKYVREKFINSLFLRFWIENEIMHHSLMIEWSWIDVVGYEYILIL